MIDAKILPPTRAIITLIILLLAFPALACQEIYSQDNLYKDEGHQISSLSGHNVGRLEYNASVDGWVIVESYYDPMASFYEFRSGDFLWQSTTGGDPILLIPASGSGGGATPPPPTIPNSVGRSDNMTNGAGITSCGYDTEPPKELEDLGIVGSPLSPIRNWLSGAGAGWAIVGSGAGGGGGYAPGTSPNNPRSTPEEADDCPEGASEAHIREAAATQQIRAAVGPMGCLRDIHEGVYFKVDFAGGKSGVYRGIHSCRFTRNNEEIEAPGC